MENKNLESIRFSNFKKFFNNELIEETYSFIKNNSIELEASKVYFVIINGDPFPPKEFIRIMAYLKGFDIDESTLFGGKANAPFEDLGYMIIDKKDYPFFNEPFVLQQISKYQNAIDNTDWLADMEIYKFKFAKWIEENIDFQNDNSDDIKEKIKTSQQIPYSEGSQIKGINFIQTITQYQDDFITNEDIEKLRSVVNLEKPLNKENVTLSFRSFPKTSIFLSFFDPNRFVIYDKESLPAYEYLSVNIRKTDAPKKDYKAFQFYEIFYSAIKSILKNNELDLTNFKKEVGIETVSELQWNFITQDFLLYVTREIMPFKVAYFDIEGLKKLKNIVNKNYDNTLPEVNTYKDTRDKLNYLAEVMENVIGDLKNAYQERPNGQAGKGKIVLKDYIIVGYSPKNNFVGDDLFIKFSFQNLNEETFTFDMALETNVSKGTSPYISNIEEIRKNTLVSIPINEEFPDNWQDLKELIKDDFIELLHTYNELVKSNPEYFLVNEIEEYLNEEEKLKKVEIFEDTIEKLQYLSRKLFPNEEIIEKSIFSSLDNTKYDTNCIELNIELKKYESLKVNISLGFGISEDEDEFHYFSFTYDNDNNSRRTILVDDLNEKYIKKYEGIEDFPANWNDLMSDIQPLMTRLLQKLDENMTTTDRNKNIDRNQILYGPPGTGKTYKTKELAVKIIDGQASESREGILNRYTELVNSKHIHFTTFHQSMSYEDFIEGIKPEMLEDEESEIKYIIQDGIFKDICEKARKNIKSTDSLDFYSEPFDLAWDKLIESIELQLSNDETPSFQTLTNKEIKVVGITEKGNVLVKPAKGSHLDYIISYNRTKRLFNTFPDLSEVKNIEKEFRQVIGGSNSSAYWSILNYLHSWIDQNQSILNDSVEISDENKYVLIIDEINRGNVSAIFGELITLIETDKRMGQKEAIEVTLPYSKEKFSVPDNIYIIGTMNTADRSVEALDTALRRRFSFLEILPNPEVLNDSKYNEVDLSRLLQTINNRIELLIDKDHQIGHSYFLNITNFDELKSVFEDKVIPLLEEYFYGDFGKIGLVLGGDFVRPKEQQNKKILAQNFIYNQAYIEEKTLYEIVDSKLWKIGNFHSIYNISKADNDQ